MVARPSKWGNPIPWKGDWIMWAAVGLGFMGNERGRREAAVLLHRAWITDQPITLESWNKTKAGGGWPDGGFIEFSDGTSRSLADHCQGIAIGATSLFPAPTLPDRPLDFTELRGKDLACWCKPDQPCHADVLLEIANA